MRARARLSVFLSHGLYSRVCVRVFLVPGRAVCSGSRRACAHDAPPVSCFGYTEGSGALIKSRERRVVAFFFKV